MSKKTKQSQQSGPARDEAIDPAAQAAEREHMRAERRRFFKQAGVVAGLAVGASWASLTSLISKLV